MQTIIALILFFFAVVLGLSQVSMMAVFMGGESVDVTGLLKLQNFLLIPMLLLCGYGLFSFYRQFTSNWLAQLWARTPGWIVFAFVMLNTMILTGFWAFQIVTSEQVESVVWSDLIPLFSSIISSSGFLIFFAFLKQKQQPSYAERNAARAGTPPSWEETWKR